MKNVVLCTIRNSPLLVIVGKVYCKVVDILWPLALLLGVISFESLYHYRFTGWACILGLVIGTVLHELAHMFCTLKYSREQTVDIGAGVQGISPFFYVAVENSWFTKKETFNINLAGLKVNVILIGLFLFLSRSYPALFSAAYINFMLVVSNLVLADSDGEQTAILLADFDIFECAKTALKSKAKLSLKVFSFLILMIRRVVNVIVLTVLICLTIYIQFYFI